MIDTGEQVMASTAGISIPAAFGSLWDLWPWWVVLAVLVIERGPCWVMHWLDVYDRLRGREPPGRPG
jgi:hypothetical protein